MLREERDQNAKAVGIEGKDWIPECSGRSEIKTYHLLWLEIGDGYQNAPGGARSKQLLHAAALIFVIPECSGRSEIKTTCRRRRTWLG